MIDLRRGPSKRRSGQVMLIIAFIANFLGEAFRWVAVAPKLRLQEEPWIAFELIWTSGLLAAIFMRQKWARYLLGALLGVSLIYSLAVYLDIRVGVMTHYPTMPKTAVDLAMLLLITLHPGIGDLTKPRKPED